VVTCVCFFWGGLCCSHPSFPITLTPLPPTTHTQAHTHTHPIHPPIQPLTHITHPPARSTTTNRSVGEGLVSEGLATVLRHRQDEERAENYDDLLVAETAAKVID
jgi:hypothetical protein